MRQNTDQPSSKFNLLRLWLLICTTLASTLSFGQAGNAPMQTLPSFPGNFAIDGFLQRQGVNGDWLPAAGGSANNFVMNNAGVPVVPLGYHLIDLYNDQISDDIFDGGNKLNDNPNVWGWRSQKPPGKDDINNATVFIALNPANSHIWAAISGDRMETNGTSYLDFEFYQNTITKIGGPLTGGFNSTGPHNGRTVGDLSLTLQYTGGGSFASIFYLQWQPGAEAGTYDYFEINPVGGSAFAAANGGVADINVPYGAFGATTYHTLQFVEGAVDMTALIGGVGLPGECGSLPFKSIFIKSKSSASSTADLKDFIAPLQIQACFDRTAPVITCPNTLNLGCNATVPGPSGATASDNCDGTVIPVASDGPVQSTGCNRTMNRTWIATDDCGNMSSCIQQINWSEDHTAPTITTGGTGTSLGCNPSGADINNALGTASATDACGTPTVSAPSDGAVQSTGCGRSQTRTWTARDGCGNTSTASRTVTWTSDVTPPTIQSGGGSLSLGCNPSGGDINNSLGTATSTDACGPTTTTPSDGPVNSTGCGRSQTRTFTARDGCGNTATTSRTVTWTADVTPPTIQTGGGSLSLGCNPAGSDINNSLGTATSTDACGTTTTTPSDGPVNSTGCSRSQTRTWTAIDGCGNTATASRTVTWTADQTPPTLTAGGGSLSLGCNPAASDIANSLGTASATDACGPTTVTPSDGPVNSTGCGRSQTRTFTARDGCGNTATTSRTVTWTADNTPPAFVGNYGPVNLGCNPVATDVSGALGTANATDACGAVTITSSDGAVSTNACGNSQTRTFTARDGCGNTATVSRTVNWGADQTPPVFTGNFATVPLGCNPAASDITAALDGANATDACGQPTVSAPSDGPVQSTGCSRSQTRSWTATDACGNTATASRTVTWTSDVTPPTIQTGGGSLSLGCNPSANDIQNSLGTATATDACGNPTVTPSDGPVNSTGCGRSQTRTWTARDACGNTSTASRTVTWTSDLTPPTLQAGGGSLSLGCNPAASDINNSLGTATATDACGNPTVTPSDGPVNSTGCGRSQTRSWLAIDGCGNTATTSRTVTWTVDVTPPTLITGGGSLSLGCNPAASDIANSLGTATATDACGTPTFSPVDGPVNSTGCSRSQTRTWTARDGCGNTSSASRTVTWTSDNTPPTIQTGGGSLSLGCNPAASDIANSLGTASATDACGPTTITPSDGPVNSTGCGRSQTRSWVARDGCGNTSTASRTVTWTADNTAPVFTNVPASADYDCGTPVPTAATPSATDACGTPTVTQTGNSDNTTDCSTGFSRVVTRKWTAVDGCGNTSTASQTIRIRCCPSVFCTYTQGQYGTEGGGGCDGVGNNLSTAELISLGLSRWPLGTLVVGKPGHSISMSNNATDIACIIDVLPGNQGSTEIAAGNFTICGLPNSMLTNQHRIKNVLAGQTITLGINMGINVQLGGLALQAGTLATQDLAGGCGTTTPKTRICHYNVLSPYNLTSVENEYTYRTFSPALIAAIPGTKNVANLFELANRALGNTDLVAGTENGVSLDEIQQAVAAINEGFDECKATIGWNVAPCPPIDPTPGDGRVAPTTVAPTLTVTAFPNPYQENFSLRVNSPVTGQASIGFYTIDGVKIGEMKRDVVANKDTWVPFNVPSVYRTRIVYTVAVGNLNAKGVVLSPNEPNPIPEPK